jgi:hypothetical protein
LKKLENGNYRKELIDNPNEEKDIIYFLKKGKIWVGEK